MEVPGSESESRVTTNQTPDRDDDGNPISSAAPTSGQPTPAINLDASTRDLLAQPATSMEGGNTRSRIQEQISVVETQQNKVQFVPTNNYFKNVSENKDVAKLVALLATCINATRKVSSNENDNENENETNNFCI